jgi:hypothetical protein
MQVQHWASRHIVQNPEAETQEAAQLASSVSSAAAAASPCAHQRAMFGSIFFNGSTM